MTGSFRASMLATVAALLATLASPGAAGATGFSQLYDDYGSDGQIQSCQYASGDLRNAAGSIPPDVQAYDPGFGDALDGALGASCDSPGTEDPAAAGVPAATPPSAPPPVNPRVADRKRTKHVAGDGSPRPVLLEKPSLPLSAPVLASNQDVPPALVALAIALGLMIVTGSGLAIRRHFAWDLARVSGPSATTGHDFRGRVGGAVAGLRERFPII